MPPGESRFSRLHAVLTQDHQSPFLLSRNLCYFATITEFDHLDMCSYHLPPSHTIVPPSLFQHNPPSSFGRAQGRLATATSTIADNASECSRYGFSTAATMQSTCFSEHTSITTTPSTGARTNPPQLSPRYTSRTNEKGHEMQLDTRLWRRRTVPNVP